jgi:hypothetical protein
VIAGAAAWVSEGSSSFAGALGRGVTPEVSGSEAGAAREVPGGTSLLLSAVAGVVLGAGRAGSVTSSLLAAAEGAGVVALEAEREISVAKAAGSGIRIP